MSEWSQEGVTMRKLEGAAKDLNLAMWVPSQGGKDSLTAELVNMSMGSGSIKKQQIAQVVMSITRSLTDLAQSKATLSVLKNRAGRSGGIFEGIYFDNGTCTVSFDGVKHYDNLLTYKEHEESVATDMSAQYSRDLFHKNTDEVDGVPFD